MRIMLWILSGGILATTLCEPSFGESVGTKQLLMPNINLHAVYTGNIKPSYIEWGGHRDPPMYITIPNAKSKTFDILTVKFDLGL